MAVANIYKAYWPLGWRIINTNHGSGGCQWIVVPPLTTHENDGFGYPQTDGQHRKHCRTKAAAGDRPSFRRRMLSHSHVAHPNHPKINAFGKKSCDLEISHRSNEVTLGGDCASYLVSKVAMNILKDYQNRTLQNSYWPISPVSLAKPVQHALYNAAEYSCKQLRSATSKTGIAGSRTPADPCGYGPTSVSASEGWDPHVDTSMGCV